jgi:hypothetical protein
MSAEERTSESEQLNRDKIHMELVDAFTKLDYPLRLLQARTTAGAIIEGKIPHLKIVY